MIKVLSHPSISPYDALQMSSSTGSLCVLSFLGLKRLYPGKFSLVAYFFVGKAPSAQFLPLAFCKILDGFQTTKKYQILSETIAY